MGVMMLYVIYYPFERFMLFWFIPVPLWLLLAGYILFDLHPVLLTLAGDQPFSQVAHAGHLGGLGFYQFFSLFEGKSSYVERSHLRQIYLSVALNLQTPAIVHAAPDLHYRLAAPDAHADGAATEDMIRARAEPLCLAGT